MPRKKMRKIGSIRIVLLGATLNGMGACSASTDPPPPVDDTPIESADHLELLGEFEGHFDEHGTLAIVSLMRDGKGKLVRVKTADTLTDQPASSSGVPSGGGVVAFSSTTPTDGPCPNGGTRCGDVRLVNRTTGNVILRNVFAVVTDLSAGWSLANSDATRGFTFSGLGTSVGRYYYEHLQASDQPSTGTTPPAIGFRADRTWSFSGPTGGSFDFHFNVYAKQQSCTPAVTQESPSDVGYAAGTDRDCDGVPGVSREHTLFVSPTWGSDSASSDGSIRLPFATPAYAATKATSTKNTIAIAAAAGGSTFSSASALTLPTTVTAVMGAFDDTTGFADRLLSSTNADPTKTILSFTSSTGLSRTGGTSLVLDGFSVRALPTAAGSHAYGMFFSGATGVTVRSVAITATGVAGADGSAGTAGSAGNPGVAHGTSNVAANACPAGTAGFGGAGGAVPGCFSIGNSGTTGGTGSPGGAGGAGGLALAADGTAGTAGAGGSAATAASASALSFNASGFSMTNQSGGAGGNGGNGGGGGGGASGGDFACLANPSAGSSGGSGGCGGTGGGGGTAGGSAVGLFAAASSNITLGTNVSVTASGGKGGNGGNGATGGNGGAQAAPSGGGKGAQGGNGGSGSGGAGGNGGAVTCFGRSTSTISGPATASCSSKTAGAGGTGGTGASAGTNGNPGTASASEPF